MWILHQLSLIYHNMVKNPLNTSLALFVSLNGSSIWPSQSSGHLPHISSLELSMIRLSCVKQYGFLLKENSLLTWFWFSLYVEYLRCRDLAFVKCFIIIGEWKDTRSSWISGTFCGHTFVPIFAPCFLVDKIKHLLQCPNMFFIIIPYHFKTSIQIWRLWINFSKNINRTDSNWRILKVMLLPFSDIGTYPFFFEFIPWIKCKKNEYKK